MLYMLVQDTRSWATEEGLIGKDLVAIYGYGHVGDGNMHLTIPAMRDDEELRKKIDDFVYEWISRYNGSCSAEHGIGLMKVTKKQEAGSSANFNLVWSNSCINN